MLLLALASGCVSVTPQELDFSPLVAVDLDLSRGLAAGFSDFENYSPDRVTYDVVERWGNDVVQRNGSSMKWHVSIRAIVLDSVRAATDELGRYCTRAEWVGKGKLQTGADGDARYCWSPIAQQRNDPEGGCIPSIQFYSVAAFQRDRLVIEMDENYLGEPATAKNPIIRELAERLRKVAEAAAEK